MIAESHSFMDGSVSIDTFSVFIATKNIKMVGTSTIVGGDVSYASACGF